MVWHRLLAFFLVVVVVGAFLMSPNVPPAHAQVSANHECCNPAKKTEPAPGTKCEPFNLTRICRNNGGTCDGSTTVPQIMIDGSCTNLKGKTCVSAKQDYDVDVYLQVCDSAKWPNCGCELKMQGKAKQKDVEVCNGPDYCPVK